MSSSNIAVAVRGRWLSLAVLLTVLSSHFPVIAQHHDAAAAVERPRVFLDKSPRIVQYQLDRLENARLLLVERNTNDPKYAPVYTAILSRQGMSSQHREDALAALVAIKQSNPVDELLSLLAKIKVVSDRTPPIAGRWWTCWCDSLPK